MTAPLTDEQLSAIEARLAAATPGPWRLRRRDDCDAFGIVGAKDRFVALSIVYPYDRDFISSAPTDIAALLAEVRRLRENLRMNRMVDEMTRDERVVPKCGICGGAGYTTDYSDGPNFPSFENCPKCSKVQP